MSGEQPWRRVKDPVEIPWPLTADMLRALDGEQFGELLRSQLIPRGPKGSPGRRRWDVLWAMLRTDGQLADRAIDVLEDFQEVTEQARSQMSDEEWRQRPRRFIHDVEMALDRVSQVQALDWAGQKATEHPEHSRQLIAGLVSAIAAHRSAVGKDGLEPTAADRKLWATLRKYGLDPRDYPTI